MGREVWLSILLASAGLVFLYFAQQEPREYERQFSGAVMVTVYSAGEMVRSFRTDHPIVGDGYVCFRELGSLRSVTVFGDFIVEEVHGAGEK